MVSPFSCEHPKKIHNLYTDTWMYVPCGQCACCRASRSLNWTARLEQERSSHPYCIFFTLTYSEEFLPKYLYSPGMGFVESSTGEFLEDNDLYENYIDSNVLKFIDARGCVPYPRVSDVQKFIKRLRECVRLGKRSGLPDSSDQPSSRYIRYYLVSELGPTTFRPHYHGLIFTSSSWLANHAKDVIASCWSTDNRNSHSAQLGLVDAENVCNSASSYVSSYLNSFTNCPKIFEHKRFRPFAIFSKAPPLGSLFSRTQEIQRLFDTGSCEIDLYRRKTNEFVKLPLPKSIYSRLYPKVPCFDRVPVSVLSELYNYDAEFSQVPYKDFRDVFHQRCRVFHDGLADYFKHLFITSGESESSIHQVFSVLRRFQLQASQFGISRNQYFNRIVKFYKDLDLFRLNDHFRYYEVYSKTHDPKEMLLSDKVLLDQIKTYCKSDLSYLSPNLFSVLKSFGYDENLCSLSDYVSDISEEMNCDYVNRVSMSKKIVNDTRKKKAKNEYLDYRQKDIQFINYLKSYHSNGLSINHEGIT